MWTWLKQLVPQLTCRSVQKRVRVVDELIVIGNSTAGETFAFHWGEIGAIETYKVDLVTTDEIRLAFKVADSWHEVSEADEGFMPLAKAMSMQFPTIPETWYLDVMLPAFATNQRTLWKRGVPPPDKLELESIA